MIFKEFSNGVSTLAVNLHTSLKSLESSNSEIAVKSRWASTEGNRRVEECLLQSGGIEYESSHDNIGVSTNVLRARVEDNIDTRIKRVLEIRRSKSIVNKD